MDGFGEAHDHVQEVVRRIVEMLLINLLARGDESTGGGVERRP